MQNQFEDEVLEPDFSKRRLIFLAALTGMLIGFVFSIPMVNIRMSVIYAALGTIIALVFTNIMTFSQG